MPALPGGNETKCLTSKEVSYICQTQSRPPIISHSPRVSTFLTGTPKQLEITVTPSKQNTESLPNRDTNTTAPDWIRGATVGLAGRRAGLSLVARDLPAMRPLAGANRSLFTSFLIVTPKRLEIDVTHTKQTAEPISNRNKMSHFVIADLTVSLPFASTFDPPGTSAHV